MVIRLATDVQIYSLVIFKGHLINYQLFVTLKRESPRMALIKRCKWLLQLWWWLDWLRDCSHNQRCAIRIQSSSNQNPFGSHCALINVEKCLHTHDPTLNLLFNYFWSFQCTLQLIVTLTHNSTNFYTFFCEKFSMYLAALDAGV